MKKEELKTAMEHTLETAKTILGLEKRLVPMAFMKHDDKIDVIALSFRNNDEKDRQLSMLRDLVRKKSADGIFVATESWYVMSESSHIKMEPSKDPTRKECIMMIGEGEDGNLTIMQTFDREDGKEDGKIIFGEKIYMRETLSLKFNFGIKGRNKQDIGLRDLN